VTAKKDAKSLGRPRSFDKDAAVDTAMRLFRSRGYDAVGVAELVSELGIKPPSFYAAFGSKAGLFRQALERYAAGETNIFAGALEQGGGVRKVIERTFANATRVYPEDRGVAGCMVIDASRNSSDPEARALGAEARQASFEAIRDFIATEFPERAEELAQMVIIALSGMSAVARDGADRSTLETFAANFSRAFAREIEAAA
jgi:TetR/AcrR family transcriptional regulator, repressor for divergent bdcA